MLKAPDQGGNSQLDKALEPGGKGGGGSGALGIMQHRILCSANKEAASSHLKSECVIG